MAKRPLAEEIQANAITTTELQAKLDSTDNPVERGKIGTQIGELKGALVALHESRDRIEKKSDQRAREEQIADGRARIEKVAAALPALPQAGANLDQKRAEFISAAKAAQQILGATRGELTGAVEQIDLKPESPQRLAIGSISIDITDLLHLSLAAAGLAPGINPGSEHARTKFEDVLKTMGERMIGAAKRVQP